MPETFEDPRPGDFDEELLSIEEDDVQGCDPSSERTVLIVSSPDEGRDTRMTDRRPDG